MLPSSSSNKQEEKKNQENSSSKKASSKTNNKENKKQSNSDPSTEEKEKDKGFITSQSIISRIKWDERFSTFLDDFTIGYLDRFEGLKTTTIKDFEESDEIPFHRIWYLYFNGIIIWDREKRIDNVSKGKLEQIIEDYFVKKHQEELRIKKQMELESKQKKNKKKHHQQVVASSSSHESSSSSPIIPEKSNDSSEEDENNLSEDNDSEESEEIDGELTSDVTTSLTNEQILENYVAQYRSNKKLKKVLFSKNKTRKVQQEYIPDDDLEMWLLEHNEENEDLVLQFPTHISQRGGHYHIIFDTRKKYEEYIAAWKSTIEKKQKFYVEEMRTKHAFRLYVDIDIKITKPNSPYDIVSNGWIKLIQQFTNDYFKGKEDITVVVTECHSNWNDKNTKSARFKSGYRLYFHEIIVDYDKFCDFTYQLSYFMMDKIGSYENQPVDWFFEDVIDLKSCNHPRCRMFGTTKWRRGHLLPRIYQFSGIYGKDMTLDEKKTQELKNNLHDLLVLTSTRVEDPFDDDNH
ncbi:hypothetical protein C9374_001639 [Naegleria lovaniensis]|uniref:MJ1316 RNA cyclic group end recognition domain-containing protein n=1 Tax=Naegleria lovaniensis TaxID=51637 RepID=A0AA88GR25_NAELO|nr:uncharacterized protein C9374_001639 [Naegleria lovaniensis]KAG2387307.1 hypothetical protein C9374_001639 [Naegleria lovaniensis]